MPGPLPRRHKRRRTRESCANAPLTKITGASPSSGHGPLTASSIRGDANQIAAALLRYRFEEALAFEPPAFRLPAPALAFPAVVLVFVDFFALDFLARLVADFADARFADARLPAVAREARGSSSPVSLSATLRALLVTLLPTLVTARVMREIVVRFAMELSPPMSWHKRNLITASSFRGMATSRRQMRGIIGRLRRTTMSAATAQ